ncbi:hypothetical protein K8S19_07945 [bacterium]|nr:hypothetical protein [bacterium]
MALANCIMAEKTPPKRPAYLYGRQTNPPKKGLESILYYNTFANGITLDKTYCENGWMVETNHLVLKVSARHLKHKSAIEF